MHAVVNFQVDFDLGLHNKNDLMSLVKTMSY